jgi:predicted nucleotidyltransferase
MLDVTPEELATIRAILDAHIPGVCVWAFGSRVSGRRKPHSDLDLAIVNETPLPLARLSMLEEAFAESDLPFRVDVVDWARTREAFRSVIRRSSVPLV